MRRRRKIYSAVPFDEAAVLGIRDGNRYRTVPRWSGGKFFWVRELHPVPFGDGSYQVLAVCPSVECAQGVVRAFTRRGNG